MGIPFVGPQIAGLLYSGAAAGTATAAVSPKTVNPAAFKSTNPLDPKIAETKAAKEAARSKKRKGGSQVAAIGRSGGRSLGGATPTAGPAAPSVLGG